MQGMWQYAVSEILLDHTAGDCWVEDCTFTGSVEAVYDPISDVARYDCPGCGVTLEREIPSDD